MSLTEAPNATHSLSKAQQRQKLSSRAQRGICFSSNGHALELLSSNPAEDRRSLPGACASR